MSGSPGAPSDPEKTLGDLLHDLRTPLNQIIGLSEMLVEIAEENGHQDLLAGLGTVRDGGLDLASMLQDRSMLTLDPDPPEGFCSLADATRSAVSRVLGFADLIVAEATSSRLEQYRDDLELIATAARNFVEATRGSGISIRLKNGFLPELTTPSSRQLGPSLSGGRMLIVDDENLNRDMLARRLTREGCHSVGARSGPEALDLLSREEFDVVLLDIQMPGMNGIEVLQEIKRDAALRHLPVIMLSALTDIDRVARCIELGAEDYLPKPINGVLLRARLGACLEKKRFRDREQSQAEELLRASKLQSIGALAGGLAHDFNNMLTAVLGNLSLIEHLGSLPEQALPLLREASRGAMRAQELTRHLLTFAEGGAPIKETVIPERLIRDTSMFVLRGSHVQCQFDLPADLWNLEADPDQLTQVISNVVLNAIEATPSGGELIVRARNVTEAPHLAPGDYLEISVQDFGVGIAPEHLDRIFDPFFTTKKQARGLGLAAAYSIVQRHGGHIGIESARGAGSTVTIHLPASRTLTTKAGTAADGISGSDASAERKNLRVLVMDDEEPIRLLVETILSTLGHEVTTTSDGDSFLATHASAVAAGRPFDLAILDLTIPGGMGGKEAIRRLRERDKKIRAIVSSGYSKDPVMAQCAEYGFDAVLPKPYLVGDLIGVVQQVMA